MQQYTRWIVLGVMAVPVGAFLIWPMLNPSLPPMNEPPLQEDIAAGTIVPLDTTPTEFVMPEPLIETEIETIKAVPTIIPPQKVAFPVQDIYMQVDTHLLDLISKNMQLSNQRLSTDLASSQAQEREAMQRNPNQSAWRDGLDIGDASIAKRSGELDKNDDVLSRIRLASLITVSGYTSASLALDSLQPVRVSVGNEFAGAKVKSITSKGVTLTLGSQTRHLQGASHE